MSESPTTSTYPGVIDSWNFLTDKEDLAEAADINKIKNSILATQTELGAAPSGSLSDVTTRLAMIQNVDGAVQKGTANPSTGLVDGQMFYRTDLNVLYVYNGETWDAQGQSFSNVIFVKASPAGLSRVWSNSASYADLQAWKWTKISGVATLTVNVKAHISDMSNITSAYVRLAVNTTTIGTSENFISVESSAWLTAFTVDVSGLTNGTTYTMQFQAGTTDDSGSITVNVDAIVIEGS